MAPDGIKIMIARDGYRYRLIDEHTCVYEPLMPSSENRVVSVGGDDNRNTTFSTAYFDSTVYATNIDCTFSNEKDVKARKLRWNHFIHGFDLVATPARWHWMTRRLPKPRPVLLQPPCWARPAKVRLPSEIRQIRTALKQKMHTAHRRIVRSFPPLRFIATSPQLS